MIKFSSTIISLLYNREENRELIGNETVFKEWNEGDTNTVSFVFFPQGTYK